MISVFDIDAMMYRLLVGSGVEDLISGGVYMQGERPENSQKEDIVINHISLTMESVPQTAVTNVNIYANDINAKVGKHVMGVANRKRLDEIADWLIGAIQSSRIPGVALRVENMTVVPEQSIKQHYVNIRVYWTIAIY